MRIDQITDAELSILQAIWERGEATTREIAEALYDEVTDPKMASAQKLLERLEAKGCVCRDRSQRAHRFRATVSQEDFLRSRLHALADRLCDGALAPLVSTLLRSEGISRQDQMELRKLVGDLWPNESDRRNSG